MTPNNYNTYDSLECSTSEILPKWSSPEVQALFQRNASTTAGPLLTTPTSRIVTPTAPVVSPFPTSTTQAHTAHSQHTQAAGIIVGCSILSVLAAIGIWLFYHRRRNRARYELDSNETYYRRTNAQELDVTECPVELSQDRARLELPAVERPGELALGHARLFQ